MEIMELESPGNNLLCNLALNQPTDFLFAQGTPLAATGTRPDPLGLTGTGRNRKKLFFCLQVVSPHHPSKEGTVGLPSNSIQGHC